MESVDAPRRGIVFKVAVITFFLLFFSMLMLFCMEGCFRFVYRNVLSTADGTSYFSVKSHHLFAAEQNSWKFRGKQFEERPDDRYRLVVAGDSLAWGQGVYPASERFPERVESMLDRSGRGASSDLEMINIGIRGFNLSNHLKFLSFIDDIKPDYVLYQWYINDMVPNHNPKYYTPEHLLKNRGVHTWFWQHSALYYLMQRWYGSWQISHGKKKTYAQFLQTVLADPNGKAAQRAKRIFVKMIHHHREKNRGFGVVLFPSFYGPMDHYNLDFLHEQMLTVCNEEHVDCLDLRDAYRDVDHKKLWANSFDPHPGKLAHKIAADAIYAHFGASWQEKAKQKEEMAHGKLKG